MEIWSLILEKIVTLEELETSWSLDDVRRAHAILEMRLDIVNENNKMREKRGNSKKPTH